MLHHLRFDTLHKTRLHLLMELEIWIIIVPYSKSWQYLSVDLSHFLPLLLVKWNSALVARNTLVCYINTRISPCCTVQYSIIYFFRMNGFNFPWKGILIHKLRMICKRIIQTRVLSFGDDNWLFRLPFSHFGWQLSCRFMA